MRAARLVACGEPPRFSIEELTAREPGPGEVAVDLEAAALNRRDWWLWRDPGTPLPVTLGSDGAGRVAALGAGVTGLSTGEDVVIDACLGWGPDEREPGPAFAILGSPSEGTFAERVVVPAANVHRRPQRLDAVEAAALNLGGLTAWRATVTCAGAAPGRRILVAGAGSGVATFAVQIAAALGAEVWVTTSSDAKLAAARALGAAGGVSYGDPDWPRELLARAGGAFDAAIDSYGAAEWARILQVLGRGGRLVSFGDTGGELAAVPVMDVYWHWRSIVGTTMGSPREFAALLEHVSTAAWRPVIDRVYPLERIDDAAARLLSPERFGKVVLTIADGSGHRR